MIWKTLDFIAGITKSYFKKWKKKHYVSAPSCVIYSLTANL